MNQGGREASVLTEGWLDGWATRLEAASWRALRDVVSTFPFEAGDHLLGPAASEAELELLLRRLPWMPDALVALYRHVGPVSLPDIGNGYFLHPVDGLISMLDQHHRADRLGEPLAESLDIVVFGSNGGGDLYAIAVTDGRVFRLQEAAYLGGVYHSTTAGVTIVATDLRDFLEQFLDAVTGFARDGSITDL
jgi:hypothetical protein